MMNSSGTVSPAFWKTMVHQMIASGPDISMMRSTLNVSKLPAMDEFDKGIVAVKAVRLMEVETPVTIK